MAEDSATPGPPDDWERAWSAYAKDRFDFLDARVDEFRSRARQLAAAVAVVVGLELALLGRLVTDSGPPYARGFLVSLIFVLSVSFLLAGSVWQLFLLPRLIDIGYGGVKLLGPENPASEKLLEHLAKGGRAEAEHVFGAYYANACTLLALLTEDLAARLQIVSRRLNRSIVCFLLACVGLAILALTPQTAYNRAWPTTPLPTAAPQVTPSPLLRPPPPNPQGSQPAPRPT